MQSSTVGRILFSPHTSHLLAFWRRQALVALCFVAGSLVGTSLVGAPVFGQDGAPDSAAKKTDDKKADEKKADDKKGAEPKPAEKNPSDKPAGKPTDKAPADKPADKKPESTESADTPKGPAVLKYEEVLAEWRKLIAELKAISIRYKLAKPEDRPPIQQEYDKAVASGDALSAKLVDAAVKAFPEAKRDSSEWNQIGTLLITVALTYNGQSENAKMVELLRPLYAAKFPNTDAVHLLAQGLFNLGKFEESRAVFERLKAAGKLEDIGRGMLEEIELRTAEEKKGDLPQIELTLPKGKIVIELFENEAPNTVANIISLVEKKYYDGKTVYIDNFNKDLMNKVLVAADAAEKKQGVGYRIESEVRSLKFRRHYFGSVSMLNEDGEESGSGFFITLTPNADDDGKYTVFGRVIEGMDVVKEVPRRGVAGSDAGVNITSCKVLRKREHEYKPRTMPLKNAPLTEEELKKSEEEAKKTVGKKEEPKKETPKKEESKKEESKKDDAKKEEPKKEPAKEEPKKEEAKKDDAKKEEPKKDDSKK